MHHCWSCRRPVNMGQCSLPSLVPPLVPVPVPVLVLVLLAGPGAVSQTASADIKLLPELEAAGAPRPVRYSGYQVLRVQVSSSDTAELLRRYETEPGEWPTSRSRWFSSPHLQRNSTACMLRSLSCPTGADTVWVPLCLTGLDTVSVPLCPTGADTVWVPLCPTGADTVWVPPCRTGTYHC